MSAHGWRGPVPNVCSKVRTYFFSNKFYAFMSLKGTKKQDIKKISETDLPTHNILLHAFNTPWSI